MRYIPSRGQGWGWQRRPRLPPPAPNLPQSLGDGPLIKEPSHFLSCLRRLHTYNDAVMFYNVDRTFKLMIRNDPDLADENAMACDISIVHDRDNEDADYAEKWTEILSLEHDGYYDDDSTFVLESFQFAVDELPTSEAVTSAANKINDIYAMTVCPCQRYLIKDGHATICTYCLLSSSTQGLRPCFCCVCQESTPQMHMNLQKCCDQYIHNKCLTTWYAKSDQRLCPLCRAPQM